MGAITRCWGVKSARQFGVGETENYGHGPGCPCPACEKLQRMVRAYPNGVPAVEEDYRDQLIRQLMAQIAEKDALIRDLALNSSPVELLKALNPPPATSPLPVDPYAGEPEPVVLSDPWGNPDLSLSDLRGDWVGNPLKETPEP